MYIYMCLCLFELLLLLAVGWQAFCWVSLLPNESWLPFCLPLAVVCCSSIDESTPKETSGGWEHVGDWGLNVLVELFSAHQLHVAQFWLYYNWVLIMTISSSLNLALFHLFTACFVMFSLKTALWHTPSVHYSRVVNDPQYNVHACTDIVLPQRCLFS